MKQLQGHHELLELYANVYGCIFYSKNRPTFQLILKKISDYMTKKAIRNKSFRKINFLSNT